MIKGDEGRGSKGALNADEGEEDDPFKAKCLISPASNFRLRWDLLMLVLIMYNVIIIPVRICFEWEAVPSDFLFWMETSMDFTFLVDVVLNFQSGFYNGDGDPVISRATIAKTYMKSWFWIDFPSSVPLDLIFLLIEEAMRPPEGTVVEADQDDNSKDFIQILKMLKFLRMVRRERSLPPGAASLLTPSVPRPLSQIRFMKLIRLLKAAKILRSSKRRWTSTCHCSSSVRIAARRRAPPAAAPATPPLPVTPAPLPPSPRQVALHRPLPRPPVRLLLLPSPGRPPPPACSDSLCGCSARVRALPGRPPPRRLGARRADVRVPRA